MKTRPICFTICVSLIACFPRCTAAVESAGQLLEKLRASDRAVLDDSSLHTSILGPAPMPDSRRDDKERFRHKVVATHKDGVWASLLVRASDMPAPQYHRQDKAQQWSNFDRDGTLNLWRDRERRALEEPDFRGLYVLATLYKLQPDNSMTTQECSPSVSLDEPGTGMESADIYISVLTSGRGYASLIERINDTAQEPSEMLRCTATGRFPNYKYKSGIRPKTDPDPALGTWELTIEPDANFIVRHARFTRREYVVAEFKNDGIQKFKKGELPVKGEFLFAPAKYGKHPDGSWQVSFEKLDDTADTELLAKNRDLLRRVYPNGVEVMDSRSGPTKRYTVTGAPIDLPQVHAK